MHLNLELKKFLNLRVESKIFDYNAMNNFSIFKASKQCFKYNINITKPAKTLQNESIFSKHINEVLNGNYPKNDMLIVRENTPKILQDLGLKNLPMAMTQKHLNTITNKEGKYSGANYHNLGLDIVRKLPEALINPSIVIKSVTKSNSIVIVTDLYDKNNNIIIISIAINGTGVINSTKFECNVITSAYGKINYQMWIQKNKENVIYKKRK